MRKMILVLICLAILFCTGCSTLYSPPEKVAKATTSHRVLLERFTKRVLPKCQGEDKLIIQAMATELVEGAKSIERWASDPGVKDSITGLVEIVKTARAEMKKGESENDTGQKEKTE